MEFSIIIPALDEADRIGATVARCLSLRPRPEVIVADGESADGTRELADARGRWLRIYLGDQAIYVRREAFHCLGGFPEILLFEDVAFSRAMSRLAETRLIEEAVVASSRRFDREGNLSRLARNVALTALYLLGVRPDRLARRYYPGYHAGRLGEPAATLPASGQGPGATTSNTAGVPR